MSAFFDQIWEEVYIMSMILRNKTNVSFTSVDNEFIFNNALSCLLYTSDAADEL